MLALHAVYVKPSVTCCQWAYDSRISFAPWISRQNSRRSTCSLSSSSSSDMGEGAGDQGRRVECAREGCQKDTEKESESERKRQREERTGGTERERKSTGPCVQETTRSNESCIHACMRLQRSGQHPARLPAIPHINTHQHAGLCRTCQHLFDRVIRHLHAISLGKHGPARVCACRFNNDI